MALAVLAPVLRPGYVLSYDMVFTPRQPLVPDAFGLGSAAPRAVPVDALLGLVTTVVPGQIVQKAVLVATLVAAGWGAGCLVHTRSVLVRCAAASWYVWNAYVAERLVIGHWSLLVAYAVLPWAVRLALGVRQGRAGALAGLVALSALAAITPGGGLLVLLTVTPVLAWRCGRSGGRALVWFLVLWVLVDAPGGCPACCTGPPWLPVVVVFLSSRRGPINRWERWVACSGWAASGTRRWCLVVEGCSRRPSSLWSQWSPQRWAGVRCAVAGEAQPPACYWRQGSVSRSQR